ncbi:MAG TPA: VOC family protein [Acidimicrobiales bacterium]|nr:VOC family protein [Acidimicrobiales bacterium]
MNAGPTSYSVSHVGICVSDLERSLRFYCEGLGFTPAEQHAIGNEFADTLEVPPDVVLASQFIRREGLSIELLHYSSPGATGRPSASRNQLGLTHLSFVVPDLDAAAARLEECGGTVIESTRTKGEGIYLLFVADPDGTRVELMQF